ncbi:single-stranded DNA-binding protein [Atopobacter sp. AH10]|uniref:single-stranded DNA-binding protein n=1 Tax=Atopobacter sp. AH10 TaxID=2315861 RepID=UPI000EF2191F|nr:single-stranded DNA-binding protein [Atopobacter sp. AH10]RLK62544.1 single-stranded DNA-binding protein [Atopobacter sp. AH10]
MNQFSGIGRVVRQIELIETPQGNNVINNVLAIPKRRNTNEQSADFIPFVVWGKTAELMHQYVKKGHQIGVSGHFQSRHYTNKQEQTVYVVELVVESITFTQSHGSDREDSDLTPESLAELFQ